MDNELEALRDWFAGQALAAVVQVGANAGAKAEPSGVEAYFAEKAYRLADAMIAARREKSPNLGAGSLGGER